MSTYSKLSIHIVDQNVADRAVLARLLQSAGYSVRCHGTISDFLAGRAQYIVDCALVDLDFWSLDNAASLQDVLHFAPLVRTVCMSRNSDIALAVDAMKAGAVDFLLKPIQVAHLLKVLKAILRPPPMVNAHASCEILDSLSDREKFVLRGLLAGRINKQIAYDMGLCERTVKSCRAELMRKVGARSFAELLLRTGTLPVAC